MTPRLDLYALFSALGVATLFITTHFTLLRFQWPRKKIYPFTLGSLALIFVAAKLVGSLGFWVSSGVWGWGPASVLGFLIIEVFFWRRWAPQQGKAGQLLLKRWSIAAPLAQALGRAGCFFAGCCFIKDSLPFNWPLLDGLSNLLLAAALWLKKETISPQKLFDNYLMGTLLIRFFLEFLRGDSLRGMLGPTSLAQVLSLCLIVWLLLDSRVRSDHDLEP